jgi:hypothetical protein
LGDATAWLEYWLRGDPLASDAFNGPNPELQRNPKMFLTAVE